MPERGVRIRLAAPEDAGRLAELIGELGYEVEAADVAKRLRALDGRRGVALVAELGGRVVGCLTTSIMSVLHRPAPVGRVSMFVVSESCRGKGIGKLLLASAESALASAGCQLIEVTSNLRRTEAHAFYEHQGYERTSLRFALDLAANP